MVHQDLEALYQELVDIHDALLDFKPLVEAPPILDSSSIDSDPNDDGQWLKHENIPGIKHLRESIRMDIDVLKKFLSDPKSAQEQPVSTHAPYLVAVFTELLCAPAPVIALFKYMHLVDGSHKRANLKEKKHHRMPSAKVDVVAENGRQWIRINTIKNAALLAEFREMDSYLTDSDDSEPDTSDPDYKPSLAPSEFTNSVLKMGQGLLDAAKANPTPEPVRITMRLTRLDPVGEPHDQRIAQTIRCLVDMGIAVELGERPMPRDLAACRAPPAPRQIRPTRCISLDLSVLVALASDLTHSALPADAQEAAARFKPPTVYRDWKPDLLGGGDHASDIQRHVRIITLQALQEMDKPLIEQIHKQLALLPEPVEFWTSDDARERCLRIVTRIGSSSEIRRAEALFSGAESAFWDGSRYAAGFVQLFPIRLYPNPPQLPLEGAPLPHPKFFTYMAKVCRDLLDDPVVPKNSKIPRLNAGVLGDSELQPAKINSKLSPNAVKSMLRGAELGWTTLTTTKSSVRALLREVRASRLNGRLPDDRGGSSSSSSSSSDADVASAVLWVVDPRNLQCFAT